MEEDEGPAQVTGTDKDGAPELGSVEGLLKDRESQFQELLAHAVALGELFDQRLEHNGPLDRDDMPAYVLFEMVHLIRLQFEACCQDLTHPWLAHAAPTHLRPVLEGLGMVAFVLSHETDNPVGTSGQRAACVALARAREEHQAMVASPKTVPPGATDEGLKRVAFYEDVHARLGCPFPKHARDWPCREPDGKLCRHRESWPCRTNEARRLTSPTMVRLTARMSFDFRAVEQASSLVLHLLLTDRLMVDTGQGTNAFADATYKGRASTLAMALTAYGLSLVWVMETVDRTAATLLQGYLASIWKRADLKAIQAGEWDAADRS